MLHRSVHVQTRRAGLGLDGDAQLPAQFREILDAQEDLAIEGLTADAREYVEGAEYRQQRMDLVFTRREQQLLLGASNAAYHYMGSGKMMAQIGRAFAEAMSELERE